VLLALSATVIVIAALLWEVGWPALTERLAQRRARRPETTRDRKSVV